MGFESRQEGREEEEKKEEKKAVFERLCNYYMHKTPKNKRRRFIAEELEEELFGDRRVIGPRKRCGSYDVDTDL